jgi:hypothetical protein
MTSFGSLDWDNPDPFDAGYWLGLVAALKSRRIGIYTNYYANATPKGFFLAEKLPLAIYETIRYETFSMVDETTSRRWINASGEYLTRREVCEAADISKTFESGTDVLASADFLKQCAKAIKLFRREAASYISEIDFWTLDGDGVTPNNTPTLAAALSYLYGDSQIINTAGIDNGASFGCSVEAVFRTSGSHFNILSYYAFDSLKIVSPVSAPSTLTITATHPSSGYDTRFDAFNTGLVEGANTFSITSQNQELLATTGTYRIPELDGEDNSLCYGFSATGMIDYGDELILTPFGA